MTRIVVTRAREQSRELEALLTVRGYEVELCPLIEVVSLGGDAVDVSGYDWVVLTSANGAAELRRRMVGTPRRVAAIGQATAAAFGGTVDLIPEISTQEGLLAELPRPAGRVLFAAAEGARQLIVDALAAEFLPLYRTRALHPAPPVGDLAVVASPSAARALSVVAVGLPVVSIGPETTRAAEAAGLTVLAEAATQDVTGVVAAVERVAPS